MAKTLEDFLSMYSETVSWGLSGKGSAERSEKNYNNNEDSYDFESASVSDSESIMNVDVAIICALNNPEFKQLLRVFNELKLLRHSQSGETEYFGEIKTESGKNIRIIAGWQSGMGMTASAIRVAKLQIYKPKYIIMTGICAGIPNKAEIGDVIVPEYAYDYNSGKVHPQYFLPNFRQSAVDNRDIQLMQTILREGDQVFEMCRDFQGGNRRDHTGFALRTGPMATGAAVVADEKMIERITNGEDGTKVCSLDMEAYGFLEAARSLVPECKALVVKSVCDLADSDKNDDWQSYCSYLSAAASRRFIEHRLS